MRSPSSQARTPYLLAALGILGATAMTPACSCGDTSVASSSNPSTGGSGAVGPAGGEGGNFVGPGSGGGGMGPVVMCDEPCEVGEICSHGVCIPQTECMNDNECDFDTFCDPDLGLCRPWIEAEPPHDEQCLQLIPPGIFAPTVKCEFTEAPMGDPFPGHVDVQGTPVVVNFNDPSTAGPPSIVVSFTETVVDNYTEDLGVIRVLRGDDCTLEANIGGTDIFADGGADYTVSSASLAVGDLDLDGVADIVAYGSDGSTMAFTKKNGTWGPLWKAAYNAAYPWSPCAPNGQGYGRCSRGWAGPAIHDLDNDGVPEVIREGVVFSASGQLLGGAPPGWSAVGTGLFPVLANLDQDAAIELTNGAIIWSWDGMASQWVLDAGTAAGPGVGHVAVADFGDYGNNLPPQNPELVVVRADAITVYTIQGEVLQTVAVPGTGGGTPTISDFDGDGLVEVAVAGRDFYTVYDLDCGANPRPGGTCNLGQCDPGTCPAGVLWSRETQDFSSEVTGSSVFDFEADGKSEVVYGDECFVRVYDGESGDVLFSQYRSSCTWYENPIIADTDGNFRADLITPSNKACSPNGDGKECLKLNGDNVDPQFNGLRCENNIDCASGTCDAGLCRCQNNADCCVGLTGPECVEVGFLCAPPEAGTPGTGNTCRAGHPHGVSGIRVYSDANDLWVRSRTIWNQHPYAVTHVNEDGTIPMTSNWQNNWEDPDLNNFRQNVPGEANGTTIPDATAGASKQYTCGGGVATLTVDVCNRGAAPMGAGIVVGFYAGGELVCQAETAGPLEPEQCEPVSCDWADPPSTASGAIDVDVVANDGGGIAECKDGNNEGIVIDVYCAQAN